jgi:ferredoxin
MNKIYYFSGRGNSLKTALDISRRLDHTELVPISKRTGFLSAENADTIGIFTPVIDLGIPSFVLNFISHLHISNREAYLYAVITNGGMPCAASGQIRKCLKKRGLTLSAEFLPSFGLGWSASEDWENQMDRIAEIIRNKKTERANLTLKDRLLTLANPLAKLLIPSEDRKFTVNENCSGCGTCERICPVGNIRIEDGKPVWLHTCEQCASCFSWCPSAAIEGTNLAARTRYRNSEVTLTEMLDCAGR